MKHCLMALVAALFVGNISAELPKQLKKHVTNTDALAFFNAMDELERRYPDSMSKSTYDSYPDGHKVINRRISNGQSIRSRDMDRLFVQLYDSIVARPNPKRVTFENTESDSGVRLYSFQSDDNVASIEGSGSISNIGQKWTINTGKTVGWINDHPLYNSLKKLRERPGAFSCEFTCNQSENTNGGDLRLRDSDEVSTNSLTAIRVICTNTPVQTWIDLHHTFMDYFGADADISLTYYRNRRMVTLIDYSRKVVWAAIFQSPGGYSNGTLTFLIGKYSEEPFLPMGWPTLRVNCR